MISKECKFSYSDLDDSLIASCKEENENSKNRFKFGNFIFNLTGRGKIIGIQVLNASEVLPEYNIDPNLLNGLKEVNLVTSQREGFLAIALVLMFKNQQAKIPIPLMNLIPN